MALDMPPGATLKWTRAGQDYSYAMTPTDMLVLARAVNHEGAPHDAVLWTLLQRFAWLYPGTYTKLHMLVTAYAQPINPRWMPGGDLYDREMAQIRADYTGTARASMLEAAQARAAKRVVFASESWAKISAEVQQLFSRRFGRASATPLPGAVHYWASRASPGMTLAQALADAQRRKPDMLVVDAGVGYGRAVNVFYALPSSRSFRIRIEPSTGVPVRDDRIIFPKEAAPIALAIGALLLL